MMSIILSHPGGSLGEFRRLIFESFVHKLLNESDVAGRMRDLKIDKEIKMFIPIIHRSSRRRMYTISLTSEKKGQSILEGYCFQIIVGERHGINRSVLDTLMQRNMFADFRYYNVI